ncbi:hypothetical protein EVAR_31515_1 [Eumeta japonica]|uniref:Uncharacterized protein n=1 Tax=Eumeta variegata TaxID=151549 RepID=A0A4C1Z1X2_EUMVA|nr:hypothetical protein EVAR_31515_1 [Eumeta japonica]
MNGTLSDGKKNKKCISEYLQSFHAYRCCNRKNKILQGQLPPQAFVQVVVQHAPPSSMGLSSRFISFDTSAHAFHRYANPLSPSAGRFAILFNVLNRRMSRAEGPRHGKNNDIQTHTDSTRLETGQRCFEAAAKLR